MRQTFIIILLILFGVSTQASALTETPADRVGHECMYHVAVGDLPLESQKLITYRILFVLLIVGGLLYMKVSLKRQLAARTAGTSFVHLEVREPASSGGVKEPQESPKGLRSAIAGRYGLS
jgi:hypothetical protein